MRFIDNFIEIYSDYIKVREATKKGYAIATLGDSINLEQPNSKTRRGRVGKQIAQTLTTSCNQTVVVRGSDYINKVITVGQASSNNSQAGKIYSTEGSFPTICACTHGYAIGYISENKESEGDYMWKNNLEKFKFNMDNIELFDSFSGIGALHKSLNKLGVPTRLVGISEIDPDSIIDYAAIHLPESQQNKEFNYPLKEDMQKWLMDKNIGWDFKKQKSSIPRMKLDKLKKLYKASILCNNYGDISLIEPSELPNFDMFNFSFCCQDISVSGKQQGMKDENGNITRSGLYVYGINIIKIKKPKYIMIENVKNLISKKFIGEFNNIVNQIEEIGYKCYYYTKENGQPKCLNAKDYGIPQNRDRIFVICVRNGVKVTNFKFPEGFDNGMRLKHLLEDTVDKKYYLSDEYNERFVKSLVSKKIQEKIPHGENYTVLGTTVQKNAKGTNSRHWVYDTNGNCSCLSATDYKQPKQILENILPNDDKQKILEIGKVNQNRHSSAQNSILSDKGLCPTIDCMGGGNRQPKILIDEQDIKLSPSPKLIGGIGEINYGKQFRQGNRVYSSEETAMCLMSQPVGNAGGNSYLYTDMQIDNGISENFKIRKLTPLECWRLMGFDDEDFYKAKAQGTSDSQLYKQAGNSIVVNVLYYIFKELFKEYIIEE